MSPVREKVHNIIRRARNSFSRHRKLPANQPFQRQPIWERLPASILVKILAQCELADIYSLIRTCRVLRHRIREHESHIAQAYLHLRRQQNRYTTEIDIEIYPSPGDDLAFISDLFPPPPPQYMNNNDYNTTDPVRDDRPDYSFGYMADLTRCWTTCIRLSYHLAEYVVQQHLQTDLIARRLWSSSKTEKELVYSKGVGLLQSRLLSSMAYLVLFLETTASATDNLPQPTPRRHQSSLQTQESILQQPPFSSTQVLLSTHHCMHLLCSTVRHMMAPEIPSTSTAHWLSLLLTTSTLERILDFFVAAAADESAKGVAGNHRTSLPPKWTKRMEFMWRMRRDWGEFVGSSGDAGGGFAPPKLDEIWFEAARRELGRRGAIPHRCEEAVPILHGSVVVLRCGLCYMEDDE